MARSRCEALVDRLIAGLDEIDGDPDLEPYVANDDREGEMGMDADF